MLVSQYIWTSFSTKQVDYYISLGYKIPIVELSEKQKKKTKKKYKYDTTQKIFIKTTDLPKSSHIKVLVSCDYCGQLYEMEYRHYLKILENGQKLACSINGCAKIKRATIIREMYSDENIKNKILSKTKATNLEKYGCENVFQNEEIKNNIKSHFNEKYNVDNPSQIEEVKDKKKKTLLKNYQVEYGLQSEEIRNRFIKTVNERYGVDYPSQNKEIREKTHQTNLERYGVRTPLENNEIKQKVFLTNTERYGGTSPTCSDIVKEKVSNTYFKNNTKISSTQQRYINNLFNGILNFPISYYCVDIAFTDEKIYMEYNGSGHDLSVRLGNITQKEFIQKEIIRNNIIKREGWKEIIIISRKDKLPSDEKLLELLSYSRNYFSENPERSWIEFDIDNGIVRNALNKDGQEYDFGKLRRLPKEAS